MTVIIPSRNYARFIGEAIVSCLLQGEAIQEVLIADGNSTDDTLEVVLKLSVLDPRVRVVSENDTGQSNALNIALAHVETEYVMWLNADEYLLPNAVEDLLRAMTSSEDCVYGNAIFVDENSNFIRYHAQHSFNRYILKHYGPYIQSCTVLFRTNRLKNISETPWDESLCRLMDLDLFGKLEKSGAQFKYIKKPVAAFRIHPMQVTSADPLGLRFKERENIGLTLSGYSTHRAHFVTAKIMHRFLKLFNGSVVSQWKMSQENKSSLKVKSK